MGKLGFRLLGIGAGIAGKRASVTTWKALTGRTPPSNPADPSSNWREAAAWTVVSGAIAGLARLAATRGVASYWRDSTGELPASVEKAAP